MAISSVLPSPAAGAAAESGPVRVGVLGYGYWGPNLARNVAMHPHTDLVAVADIDTRRLLTARQVHPVARLTTEFESVIEDDTIDAIVVATPAGTHFDLASRALRHGKHVLVTKPLATSSADAEALVRISEQEGRQLLVDHTFLFTGAVRRMKQYVESGEVGEVYYFDSTRINLGLFQHDANVIWDLAPHDISIILHLFDQPVRSVSAVGVSHVAGQLENIAYLTLRFDSALIAHIHVNWLAPAKIRQTIIGGSKKMLVYDDVEASEKLKVYDTGADVVKTNEDIYRTLVEYRTGDVLAPKLEKAEALAVEIAHLAKVCRGEESPVSDGAMGLEIVRILEAAQCSLKSNGTPVEVIR